MADPQPLSDLDQVSTPLSGSELVYIVKDGQSYRGTVDDIQKVLSVAGKTGTVTLTKGDVGLGNVDNVADADKPVSSPQQAVFDTKEPKATPKLIGMTINVTTPNVMLTIDPTLNYNLAPVWAESGGDWRMQYGLAGGHGPNQITDRWVLVNLETDQFYRSNVISAGTHPADAEPGEWQVWSGSGDVWNASASTEVARETATDYGTMIEDLDAFNLVQQAIIAGFVAYYTGTVRYDIAQFLSSGEQLQALNNIGGAPLASPALTGTPTAPTAPPGTNTTQIATTAFAAALGAAIVASPPESLNTLQKLAAAINNDPNYHTTVTTTLNGHIGSGGAAHALATSSVAGFLSAAGFVRLNNTITTSGGLINGGPLTVVSTNPADMSNMDDVDFGMLQIRNNSTGAAVIEFYLNEEPFYGYIGLDVDGEWKVGGGNVMGASSYSLLHTGNFNTNTLNGHIGSGGSAHALATTSVAGFMSASDKIKLNGVATGATANSSDATLLNRANHTGTQAISTVSGLQSALDGKEASGAAAAAQAYAIQRSNHTGTQAMSTVTGLEDAFDDLDGVFRWNLFGGGAVNSVAALHWRQGESESNPAVILDYDTSFGLAVLSLFDPDDPSATVTITSGSKWQAAWQQFVGLGDYQKKRVPVYYENGANYDITPADSGGVLHLGHTGDHSATIQPDSGWKYDPEADVVTVVNFSEFNLTVQAGSGGSLYGAALDNPTSGTGVLVLPPYGTAQILALASDEFLVI